MSRPGIARPTRRISSGFGALVSVGEGIVVGDVQIADRFFGSRYIDYIVGAGGEGRVEQSVIEEPLHILGGDFGTVGPLGALAQGEGPFGTIGVGFPGFGTGGAASPGFCQTRPGPYLPSWWVPSGRRHPCSRGGSYRRACRALLGSRRPTGCRAGAAQPEEFAGFDQSVSTGACFVFRRRYSSRLREQESLPGRRLRSAQTVAAGADVAAGAEVRGFGSGRGRGTGGDGNASASQSRQANKFTPGHQSLFPCFLTPHRNKQ